MADSVEEMEQQAAEREVQRLFEAVLPRVAAGVKQGEMNDPAPAIAAATFAYKVALSAVAIRPRMMSLLPEFVKLARAGREEGR